MIEIGTLVSHPTGGVGIVTQMHTTKRGTQAYTIKWFNGKTGVLSDWQLEVIA